MESDRRGSIAVIILILLLSVAIGAAALGFLGMQKEKQHSAKLESDIAELEIKKRSAEENARKLSEQIADLKKEIEEQKAKISDFSAKIDSLNDEISAERKAREEALLEADRSKEELAALRAAKSDLESKLKTDKEELTGLKDKLAKLEAEKEEAKSKHPDQEAAKPAEVQLEKIVVAKQESKPAAMPAAGASTAAAEQANTDTAQSSLEGKVLVVNKEYNFIVISLGKKDNLSVGDAINVLRQDKKIAEARIEEVRDTMSVATPDIQDAIKNIKEEDRAILVK